MAASVLNVAFTAGEMYDRLYERISKFERSLDVEVQIGFHRTHTDLNAHVASFDSLPYDLISTHTKYAPSQKHLLAPLEGFDTADFYPSLIDLASIGGKLYGMPRNIDLRLLHYRTDLIDTPPATWDELVSMAKKLTCGPDFHGFVFPGMESGLFGCFYELAEAGGASVFPPSMVAQVNNDGGRWAIGILRELYASGAVPAEIGGWHFEEVYSNFRHGAAAMVADWPGYYGGYRGAGSAVRDRFRVARMPSGPTGRVCCYAGSHTFALTPTGAAKEEARALLRFLTAPEQQAMEARQGSVPARLSVMEELQQSVHGEDAQRLALLQGSINTDLIIPPKLAYYPEIEDILWRTVRSAMKSEIAIPDALAEIERQIAACVTRRRSLPVMPADLRPEVVE